MNLAELKKLYLLSFTDDSPEDADFLFSEVFSKATRLSETIDGKTVSMLYLMDCTLISKGEALPFYYLYAACTHPDFRGKGLMGGLLEKAKQFAKEKGKKGIVLKPANPSLFAFYQNNSFFPYFKVAKCLLNKDGLADYPAPELFEIPLYEWQKHRTALLGSFSDAFLSFENDLFCAAASECRVFTDKMGSFVVFEKRGDTLLCKECVFSGKGPEGVFSIANALLEKTGLPKAELRFPQSEALNKFGFIENEIFSVISDIPFDAKSPYHGFAFD